MTLQVTITPKTQGYELEVTQSGGNPTTVLAFGDHIDVWLHSGNQISLKEVPAGTKSALVNARIEAFASSVPKVATSGFISTGPAHVALDPTSDKALPATQACDLSGDKTCDSCQ